MRIYYYYYKRNTEIDDYMLQLWAELRNRFITRQEYDRLWDPKIKEWKDSSLVCELLEIPAVALFFLAV